MKKISNKMVYGILYFMAVAVNIKAIFVDYNQDSGYAVSMAQRMLEGDGMLIKMWEPHQTSAFVMAGLMKLYESVFGTKEGIVLFLNFTSFLFFGITTLFLISTLKRYMNKTVAYLMGVLLLVLRPKMVQIPDYANLTIIFSVWLFIFLIRYLLGNRKLLSLLVASLLLCLNVLAYPSCVILYVGLVACILLYSQKKVRDIVISTGVCILFGIGYAGFFLLRFDLSHLVSRVVTIINADTHASESVYTGFAYYQEFLIGLGVLLLCLIAARLTEAAVNRVRKEKSADFGFILSIYLAVLICLERILVPVIVNNVSLGNWCLDKIFLFAIIVAGFFGYMLLSSEQKKIYVMGMIVSGCTFVATMLLTNLSLITIFGYTHIAAMVSMMSLSNRRRAESEAKGYKRNPNCIAIACLAVLIFSQGVNNIGKIENYVRKGPLKGLVTTLNECNKNRLTFEEWNRVLSKNDVVLIAQEFALDPIYYTYTDAAVATFSTISTISLGDNLKEYWKEFPEKEPTVIVIPSWEGKEEAVLPEWLTAKIEDEYVLSNVEDYWNFYRKK